MKWDCGLLSSRPRVTNWISRGGWDKGLPPDIEKELMIWLSMPGFTRTFHAHAFGVHRDMIRPHYMAGYNRYRSEVAENWLSATRDDCVKLAQMRKGMMKLPLICRYAMLDDVKRGMSITDAAKLYRLNRSHVSQIVNGHMPWRLELPNDFHALEPYSLRAGLR